MKKMKKVFGFVLVAVLALSVGVFASCDAKDDAPTTSLTLDKENVSIQTRQRVQITATTDADKVEFTTADETIINLSSAGKTCAISGKKAGVATVTAKAGDAEVSCAVVVSKADSLVFELDSTTIEEGTEKSELIRTIRLAYDSVDPATELIVTSEDEEILTIGAIAKSVEYDSSSKKYSTVATVTLNGLKGGMTNVSAKYGTAEKKCSIEVATYGLEYALANNTYTVKVKAGVTLKGAVHIPAQWFWSGGLWLPVKGFLAGTRSNAAADTDAHLSTPLTGAFMNQTEITSVDIPSQVELIGNNAFYGCTSLATVNYDPACLLKTLGDYAFAKTAITEAILPNNQPLTTASGGYYYGRSIFSDCPNLTTVRFADDFLQCGAHMFWNCPKMENWYLNTGSYKKVYDDKKLHDPSAYYGTEKAVFGADKPEDVAKNVKIYYAGTPEDWDAYLETVNATGNEFILKYPKSDIFFGADDIGTGSKPAAE